MKTLRSKKLMTMLLVGALAVMTPGWAMALQTVPCTPVSNMAKLSYSVGSTAQNEICSSSTGNSTGNGGTSGTECVAGTNGAGNTSFTVGVKVMVTVAEANSGTEVSVTPGGTKSVLEFTVTNDGNATHDYTLAWEDATTNPFAPPADSFNPPIGKIAIYADNNESGTYQDGTDTDTYINDLAGDGTSRKVFVVYTPDTLTEGNNAVAAINLMSTSQWKSDNGSGGGIAWGSTSVTLAQAGGVCAVGGTTIDVVAKKTGEDGPHSGDGIADGKHSDDGAYIVSNATIGVTKTYSVVWDPINYNSTPKPIPGAIVEYTVQIANSGGAAATLSTITDDLQTANLTLVTAYKDVNLDTDTPTSSSGEAFVVSCSAGCGVRACESGGYTFTSANDAPDDGIYFATPTITATMGTVLPLEGACAAGSLDATNGSVTIKFQATIN